MAGKGPREVTEVLAAAFRNTAAVQDPQTGIMVVVLSDKVTIPDSVVRLALLNVVQRMKSSD